MSLAGAVSVQRVNVCPGQTREDAFQDRQR